MVANRRVPPDLGSALVEQSPDGVIFADREGAIRVWNAAAVRMFGFTEEEALGQRLDIIVPERFREAHWRGFERALAEGKTKSAGGALPTRSHRADGTPIVVELGFSVVLDPHGNALGALATAREITARYESERADRKRLKELEAALADQS
jgi:PAS domain S-box-containing protein